MKQNRLHRQLAAMLSLAVILSMVILPLRAMAEEGEDEIILISTRAVEKPVISYCVSRDGKVSLKWDKVEGVTGYYIEYSKNEDFSKAKKSRVYKATTVKRSLEMKEGSDWYIRMRSYLIEGDEIYYSEYSPVCKIVTYNTSWTYAKRSKIHSDPVTLYYADSSIAKGITVCVNAGHGCKGGESKRTKSHPDGSAIVTSGTNKAGNTTSIACSGGTTFLDGTKEATVNKDLAIELKEQLLAAGYNVLMIRETKDAQLDNIARTVLANNNADCHIALHYDSTKTDKGAFYLTVPNVSSYRNMSPVKEHYKEHHALGDAMLKGLKKKDVKIHGNGKMAMDLTQTSYSTIPSIDMEIGDRKSSHSEKTLRNIAKGLVKGFNYYFR